MKYFDEWVNENALETIAKGAVNMALGGTLGMANHVKNYLKNTFVTDEKGNKYEVPRTGLKPGYQWYYNSTSRKVEQRKIVPVNTNVTNDIKNKQVNNNDND